MSHLILKHGSHLSGCNWAPALWRLPLQACPHLAPRTRAHGCSSVSFAASPLSELGAGAAFSLQPTLVTPPRFVTLFITNVLVTRSRGLSGAARLLS